MSKADLDERRQRITELEAQARGTACNSLERTHWMYIKCSSMSSISLCFSFRRMPCICSLD